MSGEAAAAGGMAGPVGAGVGAAIDIGTWIWNLVQQGQSVDAAKAAVAEATGIPLPKLGELLIQAQQQGEVPDVQRGETRQAQLAALNQLQDMASKGGMDEGSIAALQAAEGRAGQDIRGQREAIRNAGLRQGTFGGGQDLAAQEAAVQGSANTLALAGTQAAADARARALQAISQTGRLAGDVRSQDEALDESNRRAQIERDRFNTQLRQATNQFNSGQRLGLTNAAIGRSGAITSATGGQRAAAAGMGQTITQGANQAGADVEGFANAYAAQGRKKS